MRPPSQSTHRPTQEAGQLLPISFTFSALATLHETQFVDAADSIYRGMLVTTFLRVVWNIASFEV